MEDFRLNSLTSGLLSILLGLAPNLAGLPGLLSVWADVALKLASLLSLILIIILNVRKLRNPNATA